MLFYLDRAWNRGSSWFPWFWRETDNAGTVRRRGDGSLEGQGTEGSVVINWACLAWESQVFFLRLEGKKGYKEKEELA